MAGNAKSRSERYADELKKLLDKRDKLDKKIQDIRKRKEEAEKVEVYEYMQEMDLSPRQLRVIIEHSAHNMPGAPDLLIDLEQDKMEKNEEETHGE